MLNEPLLLLPATNYTKHHLHSGYLKIYQNRNMYTAQSFLLAYDQTISYLIAPSF